MYNFYCKQIAFSFKAINQNSSIHSVSFFYSFIYKFQNAFSIHVYGMSSFTFLSLLPRGNYINMQLLDRFFLSLYTMVYLTLISQVEHPGQPLVSSTPIPGATGSGPQGVLPGATASPTAPTSVAQVRPEGKHLHA